MYLSIGNDMAVRESSIIGIFDLDNTTTSKRTREFLEKNEKEGQVIPCDGLEQDACGAEAYACQHAGRHSGQAQLQQDDPGSLLSGQEPGEGHAAEAHAQKDRRRQERQEYQDHTAQFHGVSPYSNSIR